MQIRPINPTPWLAGFNIHHGLEVTGSTRTLYLSGQTANGADGTAMHPGDMVNQFKLAWSNLKDALKEADMGPENIVRLNFFVTDVDEFMRLAAQLIPVYASDGCKPAATLVGVTRLFDPTIMVELEAIAMA